MSVREREHKVTHAHKAHTKHIQTHKTHTKHKTHTQHTQHIKHTKHTKHTKHKALFQYNTNSNNGTVWANSKAALSTNGSL